jgi:hypothetical protein
MVTPILKYISLTLYESGMDLNMLTYFGARQKTAENWKEMLRQADPRFVLKNVLQDVVEGCLVLEVHFELRTHKE